MKLTLLLLACSLPKTPLVNNWAYSCVDSQHQAVWNVVYSDRRLLVFRPDEQVANVPTVFRSRSADFMVSQHLLHVWLTQDSQGQWITLRGK